MPITGFFPLPPTISSQILLGKVRSDRVMMTGWTIITAAMLIVFAAVTMGGFVFDDIELPKGILILSAMGACGVALRARGWIRVGSSAEIYSQFMLGSMASALVSIVFASTDLSYKDNVLEFIDARLFRVDWSHVVTIAETQPKLILIFSYAYTTIAWQPIALLFFFLVIGRCDLAKLFCLAWVAVLAISVIIFPLVPAVGGYLHNHIAQSQTHVLVAAAWRHIEILAPVREGTLRALNVNTLEGIITFPSFHASAAVLLAWGFWQLRYARWPALILNIAMLASTPFIGGHYLIDVVVGCAVAVLVLLAVTRMQTDGTSDRIGQRRVKIEIYEQVD